MALQLIHSENAALLAQLKRIDKKLKKLTKQADLSSPLWAAVGKLEAIREEIEDCCDGCCSNKKGSDCDEKTLSFLNDILNGNSSLHSLFVASNLNSAQDIAGSAEMNVSEQVNYLFGVLEPIAKEKNIALPIRKQMRKAVKCAREQVYGRQESPNNTATAAS